MTTGHDETGPRSSGPNLLAPLPGDPEVASTVPAAFEEVRAAVLEMREELAGLRKEAQAERPAPVTREELEAWGEELLKKLGEAVPKETGTDAAAIAAHAGKMAEAAERIDAGLERTTERFSAEIAATEKWLAEDRSAIRAVTSGIESATGRIEADLGDLRKRAESRFNGIGYTVSSIQDRLQKLEFDWRTILSPWAVFVFILGAVFATALKLANRLL